MAANVQDAARYHTLQDLLTKVQNDILKTRNSEELVYNNVNPEWGISDHWLTNRTRRNRIIQTKYQLQLPRTGAVDQSSAARNPRMPSQLVHTRNV